MSSLYDDKLLRETFLQVAIPIKIGDKVHQATFTNAEIRDRDVKYINSLEPFSGGDYVYINNQTFLVISEVAAMRHFKYRAKAQHCNIVLPQLSYFIRKDKVGTDTSGRPIYQDVYSDPVDVPCVSREVTLATSGGAAVNIDTSKLQLYVQDNELAVALFKVNYEFTLDESKYKVTALQRQMEGIVQLYLEKIA